jgi:hypothetical protein
VFAVSFIVYTAIEFGLYESLMHGIESITKGQTTLINFLLRGDNLRNESCDPDHHAFGQDIVISVLIASCCAAIVTNPLEVIFRNRQANPDWEMMQYFQKQASRKVWRTLSSGIGSQILYCSF